MRDSCRSECHLTSSPVATLKMAREWAMEDRKMSAGEARAEG